MDIRFEGGRIRIGNESRYLLAGEVHYWAHQRLAWPDIVRSIKASGLDMISVRPGWQYHELAPGQFDFEGRTQPERDLDGFLRLAEEAGLWIFFRFAVFSRPGPTVHTYWKGGGTPAHASDWHRLHPEFLKRARQYVFACAEVLKRHSVKAGGRLALVQCENEIIFDQAPRWSSQTLYGSVDEEYTFRGWLRDTYGTLSALNETWGTNYDHWDDVVPLTQDEVGSYRQLIHYWDRLRYQEWYVEQCAKVMRDMMKDAGLETLTVINTDPRFEPQNVTALQEIVDLVGADYWYANLMPWEQVIEFAAHAKHLRSGVKFAWSPEFQSVTTAMHVDLEKVVLPQNAVYFGLLAMMLGLKGWTWFMYVERSGQYFTPIDYWGQPVQPYYDFYSEIHRVFKRLDWPNREKLAKVGLVWYRPHSWFNPDRPWRAGNDWEASRIELSRKHAHHTPEELGTEWHRLFELLHLEDVDCEIFNPCSPYNHLEPSGSVLFFTGHDYMDLDAQRKLRGFAEKGGHLIFLSGPPTRDLGGAPTTVFADCTPTTRVSPWRGRLTLQHLERGEMKYRLDTDTSYIASFSSLPKNTVASLQGPLGIHGYSTQAGKGLISVCGFSLSGAALLSVIQGNETPTYVRSCNPGVLSSVWKHPDGSIALLALNTTREVITAQLEICVKSLGVPPDSKIEVVYGTVSGKLSLYDTSWNLELQPKDGVALLIN